jgi:transcriptional regulator with XRE-family HTH domain
MVEDRGARRSEDQDVLPERLRNARVRLGWSKETLAHRSGLSFAAISQIESGRRTNVRPRTLMALADALGVTVDHLVGTPGERGLLEHRALLYRSEGEFVGAIVPTLRGAIESRGTPLVVTTPANIELVRRELGSDARRVRFELSTRWYRSPLDATMSYRDFVHERIAGGASWVSIVGEPVWTLADAEIAAWVRYEAALNLIFAASPVTVLCSYHAGSLDPSVAASALRTHPWLISDAGPEANPRYEDPARFLLARWEAPRR